MTTELQFAVIKDELTAMVDDMLWLMISSDNS